MKNKNTTYRSLQDTVKAVLRTFIELSAYPQKEQRSKINNPTFYLEILEKKKEHFKASKRK